MRTSRIAAALIFLATLMFATRTSASTITFTLDSDHCSKGCTGGALPPFGTVTLTDGLTADTVLVEVALASGVTGFVNTGFPGSFGFTLDGNPTVSVSSLTSGWSLYSTSAGTLQFDGFGNFGYAVICGSCGSGGSNPVAGPLSFTLTAAGLTNNSFIQSTIPPGNEQAFFVADILANGTTGPVGATGPGVLCTTCLPLPPPVPEPGSLMLLGTGLIGAAVGLRRRLIRR